MSIQTLLGQTDIYLVDQIMKGRYAKTDKILDAGCGMGRNMHWFLHNEVDMVGIDSNEETILQLKTAYPSMAAHKLLVAPVEKMPFPDDHFDHIISSAVLHFARSRQHFKNMFAEMIRVVKPGGSLFIRMTSAFGIEKNISETGDGIYNIPDGSYRFLLTKPLLHELFQQNALSYLEPLKTVNVDDMRCMSTLVLQKTS